MLQKSRSEKTALIVSYVDTKAIIYLLICADIEVAFEKDFYHVSDEAQWLQVCIVIVKGELERNVTVELDTIANNSE